MRILNLEFKNFTSYGNKVTTIQFSKKGSMNMLIGQSGHGKSSIREVISYLIYGKISEKKLGDLPNRINQSLWGKITIQANNSIISIERGMNPKIHNIIIDGVVQDVAGNSNIQNILEEEYFKIPQTTFDNVISISIDKFKSFLTMRPYDKRQILDQIFGILFFNKVYDSLRNKIKDYSTDIKNLESQITILLESKKEIQQKISTLDSENDENIKEQLTQINIQLESLDTELNEVTKEFTTIQEKRQSAHDKKTQIQKLKYDLSYKISDCEKKITLYNNLECPTCGSDLTDDKHKKNLLVLKNDIDTYKNKLNETTIVTEKLNEACQKIDSRKTTLNDSIFKMKMLISKLESNKKDLLKPQEKTTHFDSLLQNTISKIDELLLKIENNKKDEFIYVELSKIFGEDGVKMQIMKNFLPSFNKSINEISKKLHFPYKIEIDEKFNSVIYSIGEEINPKTLSTGERKKADFSVLVSLIYVMKRSFPNINLLFLDEILTSLDSHSTHNILSLIKQICTDLSLDIFVINHQELPKECFDLVFTVNKVAGFSELEISEC
jgi:DNA repair exonuclease SbcCD ATPase subunit